MPCKFSAVGRGGSGGDPLSKELHAYKDNVVIFGKVTRYDRANFDPSKIFIQFGNTPGNIDTFTCSDFGGDGDIGLNVDVYRSPSDLQANEPDFWRLDAQPGFWDQSAGWLRDPNEVRGKMDHKKLVHNELVMFGRAEIKTGNFCPDLTSTRQPLLPGWLEGDANGVLLNGRSITDYKVGKGIVDGHTVRVTGALIMDCGHSALQCNPPLPHEELDGLTAVELHPVYSIDVISNESPGISLTGVWSADDVGTYYIRQRGSRVWWLGLSRDQGRSFANVFRGTLQGRLITGEWADVPLGDASNSGTLSLSETGPPPGSTALFQTSETGGFGAGEWKEMYSIPDSQLPLDGIVTAYLLNNRVTNRGACIKLEGSALPGPGYACVWRDNPLYMEIGRLWLDAYIAARPCRIVSTKTDTAVGNAIVDSTECDRLRD
jgi:hypothetical protein